VPSKDLNRFPSSQLRIQFDGPDINQETREFDGALLFCLETLRSTITSLNPFSSLFSIRPSSTLRSSLVHHSSCSSACSHSSVCSRLVPFSSSRSFRLSTSMLTFTLFPTPVNFTRLHSSTAAVSCLHGLSVPPTPPRVVTVSSDPSIASALAAPPSNSPSTLTRMSFSYVSPLKAHVIRDWISGHPKIALPLLAFLIGTLSYTVSSSSSRCVSNDPLC